MVAQMEKILKELAGDRDLLDRLRRQGMAYARECLTWDAKAESHNSGPELGCAAGSETRPSVVKDGAGKVCDRC